MRIIQKLTGNLAKFVLAVVLTLSPNFIQNSVAQDYKLSSVSLKNISITDKFWAPRIEISRTVTIPLALQSCEERGYMNNFARAGGLIKGEGKSIGGHARDSDLYKVMEGAAYSLQNHTDRILEGYMDNVFAKIAAAQWPDGYLCTFYSLPQRQPNKRYSNLAFDHELYCAGHFMESAIAYFEATGKKEILDIAIKNANHLCSTFGTDKRRDVPGHQEIELALLKLYRTTGQEKYLKLAKFFLDERGHAHGRKLYSHKGIINYMQDHKPVVQQTEAVGHAVRATYMYCAMTDIVALTGDAEYAKAISKIWKNVVTKKLYINGGIGVRWEGEAFGDDYELPNKTAHSETCAAIANVLWNYRMNLLNGDAKYIDVLELALYNRVLAGVSLNGSRVFYKGPLSSDGRWQRFAIKDRMNCCISNISRIIPQIGRFIYVLNDEGIYVNLYISSSGKFNIKNNFVELTQQTSYPWQGDIKIVVNAAKPIRFNLNLRIPGWCKDSAPVWGDLYRFAENSKQTVTIKVNGKKENTFNLKNGYVSLQRNWNSGDVIELNLPMPVHRVYCNPNVKNNRGRVAIMRGPILYCAEGLDNQGQALNLLLPDDSKLWVEYRKDLLEGVNVVGADKAYAIRTDKDGKLLKTEINEFTMIPYYAWANRGPSEMEIWVAREESVLKTPPATIASTSRVTTSLPGEKGRLLACALNDQQEPSNSKDRSIIPFQWWPRVGTKEWVQYDFKKPEKVSAVEVYWYDESPEGGCRVPKSWRLLYLDGEQWKPVDGASEYGTKVDQYNRVTFEPVEITALRIELELQPNFSTGILEWKVE